MTTAWQTVPQVTNFDKVDITELDEFRQSLQKVNSNEERKNNTFAFFNESICQSTRTIS